MMTEAIQFRRIDKNEDLIRFSEFTNMFIGVNYPLEYMQRSQVIAMTSKCGTHFWGGYIIATEGPFRVIEQLPQGVIESRPDLHERLGKAVELTGLWIHPHMKGGRARFRLWWNMFMNLLKQNFQGRCFMVYSYDAGKEKLREMYSISHPQQIYRGPVFLHGMKGEAEEIVEIGSMRAVCLAFVAKPHLISKFITKRLFRRKNFLGKVAKA